MPEPAGILLVSLGLCFSILRRRRRDGCHCWLSHQCHRTAVALALATGATLQLAPDSTALGATIAFDASAKSPAVIPFDPDAIVEGRSTYVSGRVPTNVKGPVIGGTNINTLVGADAFYSQGYTGTNAVIANIESGHVWSGHETLAHVQQIPNHPSALNEFDRHATLVATMLVGRRGGANPGAYQEGLAPDAELYSGAIASQWNGQRYTLNFNFTNAGMFDIFRRAFSTGVNATARRADVINSSWGPDEGANGTDTLSIALDGFANANPRTLLVVGAGNDGPGPNTVLSPASAYNNISVAALGPNPPYDHPASFSSGGPNDYADPVNGTKNDARQVVDIAAPGENLSAAYYGGETGGNGTTDNLSESGPGPTGLPSGSLGGPDFYSRGAVGGTSFAGPTVAGGAALLYDAAYSVFTGNADARDARVMKAVLMNSADKTIGWDNGQVSHPNGNGGVLTTQGLDNRVGTGRMNLAAAYDQFLNGTTDVADMLSGNIGLVDELGWDFGQVVNGTTNDYFFNTPLDGGSTFTATLSWFRDRGINASNTVFDDSYDDLNLELWSVVDGLPTSLISESTSLYNESEHFSFALPATGDYALRVRWFNEVFDRVADANQGFYGLAWSALDAVQAATVPEPDPLFLFALGVATVLSTRRGGLFRHCRVPQLVATMLPLVAFASAARADIFQGEYINAADPSQGKRQSTTLAPDGAGVDPVTGAQLDYRDLTMAYLIGADLRDASAVRTNLTDADLSQSSLNNASFHAATLTDAGFTGAAVRGATFDQVRYGGLGGAQVGTGLTLAQLYSTASYQERDLRGIGLGQNNLVSGDLRGQNLTNANFVGATLTDADFTGAEIAGASFDKDYSVYAPSAVGITLAQLYATASYKKRDLSRVGFRYHDFTGGNFAGQKLTQADFYAATLTDADFTGADVRHANFVIDDSCLVPHSGCNFVGSGLTLEQLYSTASYQAKDLSGIDLHRNGLSSGDFTGQNLTNADFSGAGLTDAGFTGAEVRGAVFDGMTLTHLYSTANYQAGDLSSVGVRNSNLAGGNFAGQNLTNASFAGTTLTGADFTGAEVRGASFARVKFATHLPARGTGITPAQLYSTASYQAQDLSGIGLSYNNLAGFNFAGQNLTGAGFSYATLTDANLSHANLDQCLLRRGLSGRRNLRGANLAGAVILTTVDAFTDADRTRTSRGRYTRRVYLYNIPAQRNHYQSDSARRPYRRP